MGSMVQLGLSAFWKKILLSTIEQKKEENRQKNKSEKTFCLNAIWAEVSVVNSLSRRACISM